MVYEYIAEISIHALVKRATYANFVEFVVIFYFNPRPRKEGDGTNSSAVNWAIYFNPRPRKEGDHCHLMYFFTKDNFNPRPRKEGDQLSPPVR